MNIELNNRITRLERDILSSRMFNDIHELCSWGQASSKNSMHERVKRLEQGPTMLLDVVDESGEPVPDPKYSGVPGLSERKEVPITDVIRMLADRLGVELVWQNIPDKSGIELYEKD